MREHYWAIVKVNLVDRVHDETEFNAWYDEHHVPEFVDQDGFHRGWRVQTIPHDATRGDPGQEFAAVYEIDSIDAFRHALDVSPTAGHSWGEWEGRVSDWSRLFYRVVAVHERDGGRGSYWVVMRADFAGDSDEEHAFNDWYTTTHMPEVCEHAGFHRAWRLAAHPDSNQLGEAELRYTAVYEVDSPDDFLAARAGSTAWDGLWEKNITDWRRSFHRLILSYAPSRPS